MSFSVIMSAALVQLAVLGAPIPSAGDAPALRFADLHLTTGVRLRYAEQGDRHGHPVILLHGYSDSWFSYSGVLPLLDPKYHVYALDLRGHGDSDRPASGYDMRGLAADVLAFMNAQRLARVTVVGHSMGSLVAQQLALAAPERIARLVLVGSVAAPAQSAVLIELDRAVRSLGDSVPVDFVREFQESTVFQPLPPGFIDRAVRESLKLPAYVWRGLIAGMLAADSPVGLGPS
ncbi:MAG: alpha/beta fold hydrolase, partial [Gemmatimonadales bacterium]